MESRRFWWISGAVVVAAALFGLGVILGLMLDDDDAGSAASASDSDDGSVEDHRDDDVAGDDEARDDEGARPGAGDEVDPGFGGFFDGELRDLLEELFDDLAERFGPRDGDSDRPFVPREEFRFDFGERLVPEDLREFGECLGDGAGDLFDEDSDEGILGRARELWERCTA